MREGSFQGGAPDGEFRLQVTIIQPEKWLPCPHLAAGVGKHFHHPARHGDRKGDILRVRFYQSHSGDRTGGCRAAQGTRRRRLRRRGGLAHIAQVQH